MKSFNGSHPTVSPASFALATFLCYPRISYSYVHRHKHRSHVGHPFSNRILNYSRRYTDIHT